MNDISKLKAQWPNIQFLGISSDDINQKMLTNGNTKIGANVQVPISLKEALNYIDNSNSREAVYIGQLLNRFNMEAGKSMASDKFYCSYCNTALNSHLFAGHIQSVKFCTVCLCSNPGLKDAYERSMDV